MHSTTNAIHGTTNKPIEVPILAETPAAEESLDELLTWLSAEVDAGGGGASTDLVGDDALFANNF